MTEDKVSKFLEMFPGPSDEEVARRRAEREAELEAVRARLPEGLELDWYGGGCPWQADGTWQGRTAYLRFRGNQASMTVWAGEAWESEVVESCVVYPYLEGEGHEYAGSLEGENEVVAICERLVGELAVHDVKKNPTSGELLGRAVEAMSARHREHEAYKASVEGEGEDDE